MDLLKTLMVYMMIVLSSATEANPYVTSPPATPTPAPTPYVSPAPTQEPTEVPVSFASCVKVIASASFVICFFDYITFSYRKQ